MIYMGRNKKFLPIFIIRTEKIYLNILLIFANRQDLLFYLRSSTSYTGTTWNGLGISGSLATNTSNLISSGRAAYSVGSSF